VHLNAGLFTCGCCPGVLVVRDPMGSSNPWNSAVVQGNCSNDKVPFATPQEPLKPKQCLLRTKHTILVARASGSVSLWVHNLYILSAQSEERIRALYWEGLDTKLWVTDTTMEGNAKNSSALTNYESLVYVGGVLSDPISSVEE
jgi:hypothetical protein